MLNSNTHTESKFGVAKANGDDRRESASVIAAFVACFAAIAFALLTIASAPLSNIAALAGSAAAAGDDIIAVDPDASSTDNPTAGTPASPVNPDSPEAVTGNVVDMTY